jgi:DNA-binding CsgD family transcriptional regulator
MCASNAQEYLSNIVSFAHNYDFAVISAIVIVDHSPTLTQFSGVTNVPSGYLNEFNNLASGALDPVSQHCKRSRVPIVWDSETYAASNCLNMWELQAAYGLKEGISVAMHLPHGKHFFFGMDCDRDLKKRPDLLKNITSDFLTYMSYAQAGAFEILNGDAGDACLGSTLSSRELDALKFTMDGKTAADIANLIGSSARVVELRLIKAMRKLGCSTKYQAVLKAIRLGHITC